MNDPASRFLSEIKTILINVFREQSCEIYLFGSRAVGNASMTSDFDIAISSPNEIDREISHAREILDESNIPYMVDLVDLKTTSAPFRNRIMKEGILLWRN